VTLPTSSNSTAATWKPIFTLPARSRHRDPAGLRDAAQTRDAPSSRRMMTAAIHAGARSIWTSETSAAVIQQLVGKRVEQLPSVVTCRWRRAR